MDQFQVFGPAEEKSNVQKNNPKAKFCNGVCPLVMKHWEDVPRRRAKARFCAQGNRLFGAMPEPDTGYGTQFSAQPSSLTSVRLMAFIGHILCRRTMACDVDAAYLQSSLEDPEIAERIPEYYMQLPKYAWREEWKGKFDRPVVRIRRALYGLQVSGFVWMKKCRKVLEKQGWEPLNAETSIYKRKNREGKYDYCLTYVDDIIICAHEPERIWKELKVDLRMKEEEDLDLFMGVNFKSSITPEGKRKLQIFQYNYCRAICKDFWEKSKQEPPKRKVNTPMIPTKCSSEVKGKYEPHCRHFIGSLLWLCRSTRCDISYVISWLSRFVNNWTTDQDDVVERVFAYLHWHCEVGLELVSENKEQSLDDYFVQVEVDAAFADCETTKRSTGGYVIYMARKDGSSGRFPVEWSSKRQGAVTGSTAEAELVSVCIGLRAAMRVATLYQELKGGDKVKVEVLCDAAATIAAITSGFSAKLAHTTRHLNVSIAWAHEALIQSSDNEIKKISSESNSSDLMTKPLPLPAHKRHMESLSLREESPSQEPEVEPVNETIAFIANARKRDRPTISEYNEAFKQIIDSGYFE